jgi:beta-lactamase regulating signal transducer with metallopeptidase domain
MVVWMAYATLLTAALAFGGIAVEHLAGLLGAPRRMVWAAIVVLAIAVPAMLALRPSSPVALARSPGVAPSAAANASEHPLVARSRLNVGYAAASASTPRVVSNSIWTRARSLARAFTPYVLLLWLLASLFAVARFAGAAFWLNRRSRCWRPLVVDTVPVLIAPDIGPAVVGTFTPRIVLPEWALGLARRKRSLVLRHELEHIHARDPLLLRAASIVLALFPWNAPLWLVVRRLRQAIEIDCDQRVLDGAGSGMSFEYGLLLLLVSARRDKSLALAAFAGTPPFLERRLKAMAEGSPRSPRLISAALISVVVACSIGAARVPLPPSLRVARPISRAKTSVEHVRRAPAPALTIARPAGPSRPSTPVPRTPVEPPRPRRLPPAPPSHFRSAMRGPAKLPAVVAEQVRIDPNAPVQTRATSRVAVGRVTDASSGEPLPRVYVSVVGVQAIGEPNWTCSDADGAFRLRVPVGEAWLSAQRGGWTFDNVTLPPTDSVAEFRGRVAERPVRPNRDPLYIIDGVPVAPTRIRDTVVLRGRSASGQPFDWRWVVGERTPRYFIDGQEVTWIDFGQPAENPCGR